MNENLNLVEILKDCPEGTKLYSPALGEVEFVRISDDDISFPIRVRVRYGMYTFSSQGRFCNIEQGECLLFPSKEQRDWDKFKPNKTKQSEREELCEKLANGHISMTQILKVFGTMQAKNRDMKNFYLLKNQMNLMCIN